MQFKNGVNNKMMYIYSFNCFEFLYSNLLNFSFINWLFIVKNACGKSSSLVTHEHSIWKQYIADSHSE